MENYLKYPKGSEWRKWDLHIHTPISIKQEYGGEKEWEKFVDSLERLPEEVKVIGINDYYFIDGYEKVMEYRADGRLKNIEKIFPVLEFRIDTFGSGNENKLQKINLHVIFNIDEDKVKDEIRKVKKEFIEQIPVTKLEKHKTKCLSKKNLTIEGGDDLHKGFGDLIPPTDVVFDLLGNSTWKDNVFLLLGYKEWSNLEKNNQLKPLKEDLYGKVSAFFTANSQTLEKSKKWLDEFGNKPLLHSCDIHDFNILDTANRDKDGEYIPSEKYHCHTWIKGDPTFEGLKQIAFEPTERVRIQKEKPLSPIKKLEKIELSFDDKTEIELKKHQKKQEFCFGGFNEPIFLSDYFTCFIGGRGTGKSTLLNLIYKGVKPLENSTTFLEDNKITVNNDQVDLSQKISIDSNTDEVEFLEQNQIEKFATDSVAFTRAIYKRILDFDLLTIQNNINTERKKIEFQLDRIKKRRELNRSIKELEKKINDSQKIIDTNKTDEYQELTKKIKQDNAKYLQVKREHEKYQQLINSLQDTILKYPEMPNEEVVSKFGEAYNDIIKTIEKVFYKWLEDDFSEAEKYEGNLLKSLEGHQEELEKYLEDLGLTQENLKDITNANVNLESYKSEKKEKEKELQNLQKKIDAFSLDEIKRLKKEFDEKVKKRVSELKSVLDEVNKENPKSVEKIDFEILFNHELAEENVYNDFIKEFDSYKIELGARNPEIMNCLFNISPASILSSEKTLVDIRKSISGTKQYNLLLDKIFEDNENFEIYKLIISSHLLDSVENLKIEVYYKGKTIEQASFGQKCTAVIVIMLLFGNNPIIIDEPEAHLDSSLIAKYLVELVKKKKKERQIIFATHNANFVINGDAELIHVLEMSDKTTEIIPTTIEDKYNRKSLLKLEGGEKAFEDRRNKYNILNK